ncbi:hypothetical protein JCM10207_008110 [Rhodosporidiobolus poonsookiae]
MRTAAERDIRVVKINGKKLFVDDSADGKQDLPTIFFMHGLGSNTSFWEATIADSKLKEKYRLVRYDFDGHGLSPVSSLSASDGAMLSLDDLVEDLVAVMDYAGVDKAAGIVGHSMSGLVASTFASRHPDRVDKLVLLGAMRALAPAIQTTMLQRASTVIAKGMSSVVQQVVSAALSDHTKQHSPLSAALVRTLVLTTPPGGYASACHALAGATDPDYSRIKLSGGVLVVSGEYDYMSNQETTEFLEQKIPDAKKVVMKDVGHWHAVEQPLEVRKIFEEWFL